MDKGDIGDMYIGGLCDAQVYQLLAFFEELSKEVDGGVWYFC